MRPSSAPLCYYDVLDSLQGKTHFRHGKLSRLKILSPHTHCPTQDFLAFHAPSIHTIITISSTDEGSQSSRRSCTALTISKNIS